MEIKTPDLGVDSAEVSEIMVNVGDVISENDNIILLESDKASVEVPSPISGTVKSILVSLGDTVSEGVVLLDVDTDANAVSEVEQSEPAPVSEAPIQEASPVEQPQEPISSTSVSEKTYTLPDLGVDSAEVAEILISEGDEVEAEQSILLVESDKASVEVPAPVSGKVTKLLINVGETINNGQDFIVISSGGSSTKTEITSPETNLVNDTKPETKPEAKAIESEATDQPSDKLTEEQVNSKLSSVYAGPAVRKLARQMGVDITDVKGSAVNNRILKEDLFAFIKERMQKPSAPVKSSASNVTGSVASLPPLPNMSKTEIWGEIERVPLTRLQKVSIPQLNYNTLIPQVTQFDLADITETEAFRSSIKAQYKAEGIGLTILAFMVKVVAYALMEHPKFNSHLSDDNTELLIRKSVNMGIAVATPEGLVVPVIKNAQDKGIKQLAIEIGQLAKKARDKKLSPQDITGASFTISSQGNLGGTAFTPLVTWPQVAILGVSESSMQPRWNKAKGDFESRLMLPLSLSYDHRVINGADAAVFTRYIATLLADPRRVLM